MMVIPSSTADATRVDGTPTSPLAELADRAARIGAAAATNGKVTTKAPALQSVSPDHFALAVAPLDGELIGIGEVDAPFSLQSITKLFALCALVRVDADAWTHVGWDSTELGYGSLAELEQRGGRPRSPFVNAGALVVTDRLLHHTGSATTAIADLVETTTGVRIVSDPVVAHSEAETDHRNRAIAHMLAERGRLIHPVEVVLEEYFHQCAMTASVRTVARAAHFLVDRRAAAVGIDATDARRINAVTLTSGMYAAAGEIAYRIGLPAKSGIGGGVLAVLPSVGTICAWSPPLDPAGNSVGGVAAIEDFARAANWSLF